MIEHNTRRALCSLISACLRIPVYSHDCPNQFLVDMAAESEQFVILHRQLLESLVQAAFGGPDAGGVVGGVFGGDLVRGGQEAILQIANLQRENYELQKKLEKATVSGRGTVPAGRGG